MNWETIKFIYRQVLIHKNNIEYLGENRYRLIRFYPTGEKRWEVGYKNGKLHGKYISWHKNGNKYWETEYQNGELHGKDIGWYENGQKHWEEEYKNGKLVE